MLLKNILHHWISKKNHSKKSDRPQGALPLGRKGRYGFSAYVATVLCVGCLSTTAFAASDPLRVLPACILGSGVAGALSMLLGCASPAPHGGLFVFPVMHNVPGYFAALAVGSLAGMLLLAVLKRKKA